MRKSFIIVGGSLMFGVMSGVSQIHSEPSNSPSSEFEQFRQQIFSDYDSFKSRILEHYADFLNGEWHEFEPLWEEESPYTQPKPKALPPQPVATEPAPQPEVAKLPTPRFGLSSSGGVLAAKPGKELAKGSITDYDYPSMKIDLPGKGSSSMPQIMAQSPSASSFKMSDAASRSNYEKAVLRLPDPEFTFGSFPGQTAAPNPGESGIVNIDMADRRMSPEDLQRVIDESGYATEETFKIPKNQNNFLFDFYGMEAFVPEIKFEIASAINGHDEMGAHWQKMAAQEGGVETSRQLFGLAQQLGLNGYLTYRLAEAFVNQKFKNSNPAARMSAIHFLITNMGYDARLTKVNDTFMVMMPFDQKTVYGTMSQTVDGRKYTILYPDGFKAPKAGESVRLLTCKISENTLGKTSDLRLTGLSLPMKAKPFNLTNGKLTLKGEVNENIKNILHHYPQMPTGDFASSWVDSRLREDIVDQVKTQLAGKTEREAVNALMALCHNGFNYSTDQDFHGFEKPYFLEENFIYDKNDCEDRAIFFSYLLWNALGLPCQLVQYPGHESATVAVDEDIAGYYYNTDGTKYYSADPTYIGSTVGMVMNAFKNTSPTVDKQYK
ncbi:MAG: hypothetical protein K2N35_14080 [Muribaculaceae bacterium]|nr:hypothetical protein [Muribaculaceae bacterium]